MHQGLSKTGNPMRAQRTGTKTPADSNYSMPAEFAEHECCWMAWPCQDDQVPGLLEVQHRIYADVANAIAAYEPVNMLVDPTGIAFAKAHCGPGVNLIPFPLDDAWLRDNGPTFVIADDGRLGGVAWQFNGWGQKFACAKDARAAGFIIEAAGAECFESPLVLEGGAITVDGEGTLIATEQCLLNANRSGLGKYETESVLSDYLGAQKIIWLKRGLSEDAITDGHVDLVASFVGPGRVMVLVTHDEDDVNFALLRENLSLLKQSTDAAGRRLKIVEVEQADAADLSLLGKGLKPAGELCRSYINFYFANKAVIIPGLDGGAFDRKARKVFEQTFPDREIVQIYAPHLYMRGGNIHCITQQQPKTR